MPEQRPGTTDFDHVPINQYLRWKLRSSTPEGAEVVMSPQGVFAQEYGVVHGGIITAVADTCAVYAIHPFLPANEWMTSVELKINFLRAGRVDGGEIVARSKVIRRGRTIALCDVEVWQDEAMIAKGLFTYVILRRE